MGEITAIILSIGMVLLCWIMIKINDKIDRHIKRFKKLESALLKNSTNKVNTVQPKNSTRIQPPSKPTSNSPDAIPSAQTARDLQPSAFNFISKK